MAAKDEPHKELERLQNFYHLIYVEAPRLLQFLKTGLSYGAKVATQTFQYLDLGKRPRNMHFPPEMRHEFKILTATMPLNNTPWAFILDHRAVTTENTIEIPATFSGFAQAELGFYPPNPKGEAAQKIEDKLVDMFNNEITPVLNIFLEIVYDLPYDVDHYITRNWSFTEDKIKKRLKPIIKLLNSLESINPSLGLPDIIKDVISQFENQGHETLDYLRRFVSGEAEGYTGDYGEEQYRQIIGNLAEKASRSFQKIISELATLSK